MRRATLGNVSPAQLNSRTGPTSTTMRSGVAKQSRVKQQPPPSVQNGAKSGRNSLSRRNSSLYGKGNQPPTETRPIGDRAFQQECIRSLVNYLTTHGFNTPVSQKSLQTPSSKDVVNIIQFLFLQIDPTWEFKKIEEDVPMIFRKHAYPGQINRSCLYAAGSPMSWPSLLAALTWLVNLLTAMEPSEDGQGDPAFDDYRGSLFTDYINAAYAYFLKGEDDRVALLDKEYLKRVEDEVNEFYAEFEAVQAEGAAVKEKLRELKSEPSPLAALEAKHADFVDDLEKFKIIASNFLSQKQALEKKRDDKREEQATKQEELVTLAKENEELRERIVAQQGNKVHVEKQLQEIEILEVNLQSLKHRLRELQKSGWDNEKNCSKTLRDLEDLASQFNDSRKKLAIAGEDFHGHSLSEIKVQPRAELPADVLGGAVKTLIKPSLRAIIEKSKRTTNDELKRESLREGEEISRTEKLFREKEVQISVADVQIQKMEALCKAKEEKVSLVAKTGEAAELEARMVEEELGRKNEEAEVDHEIRELNAEHESRVKFWKQEVRNSVAMGKEVLDVALIAKEKLASCMRRAEDVVAQSMQVFNELLSSPPVS